MNELDRICAGILDIVGTIIRLVFEGVAWLEGAIRHLLAPLGLGPNTQSLIMLLVLLLILLAVLNLLGGVLRVLLFVLLLLALAEAMIPLAHDRGPIETAPLTAPAPATPTAPAPAPAPAAPSPAQPSPTQQ
jgi:hypothetical protein